jgi:UPF0755 protein
VRRARAALLLTIVLASAVAAVQWARNWVADPAAIVGSGVFILARGHSISAFAHQLHAAGVLQYPRLWVWLARLDRDQRSIKAGEYRIGPDDTPYRLLLRLREHDVVQHRVTLIEGWTFAEALVALERHPVLKHTVSGLSRRALAEQLGLTATDPEGWIFPDTYTFERGATDVDVLKRGAARMARVLAEAWAERQSNLPLPDPEALLTLASIIEKETGRAQDRGFVAQVFINRLRLGMRLQTDPTVIYGLGARFTGDLTRAHLAEDTPYNSYQRAGLPPTPIALPGRAAIEAAARPPAGDYLYFVSRGDGSSAFSRTLEAHNRAVRKYQLN